MKRSGRISPLLVLGILCLLLLVPLFCASKKGAQTVAAEFMEALGRGDVNKLADLGAIHGTTEEQRRALWQKTIERSKHYLFTWRITDAQELDPKTAAVRLQIRRDLQLRRGQDEMKYELPLTKDEKGDWKVDVGSMDRGIYPALPRG